MGIPVSFDVTQTGVGTTDWLPLNRWGSAMTFISAEVTGTVTYRVEATTTNVLRSTSSMPAEVTELDGFTALTSTSTSTQSILFRAVRVNVVSGTGSVRLRVQSGVNDSAAGGAFTPLSLFANNEQGAWYDPSDLSTLYQDSAGTTPVTGDGQPVGLMMDKSGNGNDASQATAAAKPVYRTDGVLHWLEGDGVDDRLETQLSPTDSYYVGLAYSAVPAAVTEIVFGASPTDPRLYVGVDNTGKVIMGNGVDIHIEDQLTSSPLVASCLNDSPHNTMRRWVNGSIIDVVSAPVSPVTSTFQVFSALGYSPVSEAKFYGAIVVNKVVEVDEVGRSDSFLAKKAGVAL